MTNTDGSSHFVLTRPIVLVAASVLSGAGALVFNAFPLFLSAIADQLNMGDAQLGLLGTAFLVGFALVALVAEWWVVRVNWKVASTVAYLCIGLGSLSLLASSADTAYLSMALLGVGCSIVFTIGLTVLSRAKDPDRAFGIKLMFEMAFAGLIMVVMTKLIMVQFGFVGFVVGVVIFWGLTAVGLNWLPENFMKREAQQGKEDDQTAGGFNIPAWAGAVVLFVQFGVYSGLWGFMERIGSDSGAGSQAIGTILSLSIAAGFLGAMAAAIIGNRLGQVVPMSVGFLLTIAMIVLLHVSRSNVTFGVAACTINALIQFMVAYQMGFIASRDGTGRFTVMIPFILAAGGAVGPGVAGGLAEASGFSTVYICFGIITAVNLVITLWACSLKTPDPTPAQE
jgi:cyanate permease